MKLKTILFSILILNAVLLNAFGSPGDRLPRGALLAAHDT
jgi:hypothetical protein